MGDIIIIFKSKEIQMSRNKEYRCNVIFSDGRQARTVVIEAINPPEARDIAERQFGGRCTSANQCG